MRLTAARTGSLIKVLGGRPLADNLYALLQQAHRVATIAGAKIFGVEIALVTNVKDPDKQGRVKVCFPMLPGKPESDWARVVQPAAGAGRGFYWLPEEQDEVLVAFERGEANRPFVVGALWNGKDQPMKDAYTDENTTRMLQTRSGHQIILDDAKDAERIVIADKSGKRTLTFDVKSKKFLIEAGEGDVVVKAAKKIVLACEDLEIKTKKTGKMNIGTTFDLEVKAKGQIKSGPRMDIKASKVHINPSSGGGGAAAALAAAARAVAARTAAAAAGKAAGKAAAAGATGSKAGAAGGGHGGTVPTKDVSPKGGAAGAGAKGGAGGAAAGAKGGAGGATTGATAGTAAGGKAGTQPTGQQASAPRPALTTDAQSPQPASAGFKLSWTIKNWAQGMTASLACDQDIGDGKGTTPQDVTGSVKADGSGTLPINPPSGGAFKEGAFKYALTVTPQGAAAVASQPAAVTVQRKDKKAILIEVEDAHFRFDSAVFLPEPSSDTGADAPPPETVVGLDTLKTIYLRAKEFPEEKVLIAGHTDTTGPDAYNAGLSEKRAGSVEALLRGDGDAFAKISQGKHQAKDVQQILSWAARTRQWDCDPGGIDGQIGKDTNAALRSFKKHYDADFEGALKDDAKIDVPFWRAVFDLYLADLGQRLDVDVSGLAGFRSALKWVDEAKRCVGCGESWPIEEAGKKNFRSATNRRVEVLFFEPGDEPRLDCHPAPGKCVKSSCELYPPGGAYQRTPLPVHPNPRPQSTPAILVPEQPGSANFVAPNGLHAFLASYKRDSSDLDRVSHFVVRDGKLSLPGGSAPAPIDCDRETFFYFSHRDDLADDASARNARFAKDRSGLPLVGPVTVPCGAKAEIKVDLWQQNDWVLFRARQIDARGPDAVQMAEWREDYKLGIRGTGQDGKPGFWISGHPLDKDIQERWKGRSTLADLVRLSTPGGVPLLVGTLSALPSAKAKIVARKSVASDSAAAGTSDKIVVATWNELAPAGRNLDLPGLHQYDRALVEKLSALEDSDQGNAAIDALPAAPGRFLLPGDMNWQDQGQTNNCGAYSFSTAMNYWFPYTNNAGDKNGAYYSDTNRVPSVVNGARTPANIVEAAQRFQMNGRDNDAEELDKVRAIKLLKLWVSAGVPVLVLVKENSAAGFFTKLVSYHWKTVVGWDGDRLYMNNSGGDQENDISLRKPGFDYEHGPVGNDMDPIDTHFEKWEAAGGDIVDLLTSVDECTFIPVYPKAPEYAGDRVR